MALLFILHNSVRAFSYTAKYQTGKLTQLLLPGKSRLCQLRQNLDLLLAGTGQFFTGMDQSFFSETTNTLKSLQLQEFIISKKENISLPLAPHSIH
jgi:hypothetical protein